MLRMKNSILAHIYVHVLPMHLCTYICTHVQYVIAFCDKTFYMSSMGGEERAAEEG
jgi:hypothetical protein